MSATIDPSVIPQDHAYMNMLPRLWPAYRRNVSMKLRNPRPVTAACIGRRIMQSPPRKPAAGPEKKTAATSANTSPVTTIRSERSVPEFES